MTIWRASPFFCILPKKETMYYICIHTHAYVCMYVCMYMCVYLPKLSATGWVRRNVSFLNGVVLVWIKRFPSPRPVAEPWLKQPVYYEQVAGREATDSCLFKWHSQEGNYKQSRPGFEHCFPSPFPTTKPDRTLCKSSSWFLMFCTNTKTQHNFFHFFFYGMIKP